MATTRSKKSARPKASAAKSGKSGAAKRPAPKPAKAVARPKPAARAKVAAKPAAKPVKAAAPAKVVKGAAVKGVPAKGAVAAKGAPPKGAVAVKGVPAKGAKPAIATKPGKPVKAPKPPAVVRPLGVLPPEARAHVVSKPVAVPPKPRPAPAPIPSRTSSLGVQRVSEKDLKFFEERLLAERAKILKDMGHLENTVLKVNQRDSSGDLSGYSFHMADAGTDAMEREKAFMFASAEGRMLMEIDDALRRVYQGSYGICEICTNPIARARLEAMPYARLCVSCKEQEEKANRTKSQTPGPATT